MNKKLPNSLYFAMGGGYGYQGGGAGEFLGEAGSGAAMGAQIGSVLPGIGNVAGGIIGGGVSLMNNLSDLYGDTKFGKSKLGKVAGFAASPIFGAMNLIGQKKDARQAKKMEAQLAEQRQGLSDQNMSMINSLMANTDSSNLPMALGGELDYKEGGSFNPIGTFTEFPNGGTHEENPYGGILQGKNDQGQMRKVEAKESKFKFKEGNYIFSNRLKYE